MVPLKNSPFIRRQTQKENYTIVRTEQRQSSTWGTIITKGQSTLLWGIREGFTEGEDQALSRKTVRYGFEGLEEATACAKVRRYSTVRSLVVLDGRVWSGGVAAGQDSGDLGKGSQVMKSLLFQAKEFIISNQGTNFEGFLHWKATCLLWILSGCPFLYTPHHLCFALWLRRLTS